MFKFNLQQNQQRIRRRDFKTENDYLGALFEANKTKLTEVYGPKAKSIFTENVKAIKVAEKTNSLGALRILSRSRAFTPYTDIAHENIITSLKKFGKYKKFREMTKDARGKFTRIDPSKFTYRDGAYYYEDRIRVDFDSSPEDIHLSFVQ